MPLPAVIKTAQKGRRVLRKVPVPSAKQRNLIATTLVVGGGVYFANRWLKEQTRKATADRFGDDEIVQLATSMRNALNPSGISWLMAMDGTKTDEVLNLAAKLDGKFAEVSKAYRDLYGRTLSDDIQSELSADEFTAFKEVLQGKRAPSDEPLDNHDTALKGKIGIIKNAEVRSTPFYLGKVKLNLFNQFSAPTYDPGKNYLDRIKNKAVGFATGKISTDSKGKTFVEFKDQHGKLIYIDKTQIANLVNTSEFNAKFKSVYPLIFY